MKPRSSGRGRLSRSAEFERVYRQGRATANRHLALYTFATSSPERPRLGLSVSRKVGGAVERNRAKRLIREAFRAVSSLFANDIDVVVIVRRPLGDAKLTDVITEWERAKNAISAETRRARGGVTSQKDAT